MNQRPAGKWYYWVLLALVVKCAMFFLLSSELGVTSDNFIGLSGGDQGGDANSYLTPVENYINTGEYDPDYRMPGFAVVYYLLRLFFNIPGANNAIVLLQSLLSAISVYFLALTALRLFKSVRMFYMVFFTYLIATYTQLLDLYLLTESFTVSASIFAVYFLLKGFQDDSMQDLLISGIWTTWIIFLRPVYAPYLAIFSGCVFIYSLLDKKSFRRSIKLSSMLLIPFLIVDGMWIVRNYKKHSSFQPLTSLYYPDAVGSYYIELLKFLQSWGGNYVFWDPSAEIRLLGIEKSSFGPQMVTNSNVKIPENIYTSAFNSDSLKLIRSLVISMQEKNISKDSMSVVNDILKEKLIRYTASVKEEHPLIFYVTSRLRYFRIFLLHSGTYNLMSKPWKELNLVKKVFKLFYSAQYLFIVLAGLAGSILMLIRYKKTMNFLLPLLTLYSIILFPWILMFPEVRYFVPAFPFMLICAMYVTNEVINRLNSNRFTIIKN